MSPRRRIEADEPPLLVAREFPPPCWQRISRPSVRFAVAGLVMTQAIVACALMLIAHESQRRDTMRDVAVLGDVSAFMTLFTSPDPYHANDYVDQVLARTTGEFATEFEAKANQAVAQVVQSQPATGSVLGAGVQRWNDDGSVNVLIATNVNSTTQDGKETFDVAYRWLVTAAKEGDQWKISNLTPVI